MARIINNSLTHGLSGMVGKQIVFRTWNGKTYVASAPKKPSKQSAQQKQNRHKFREATLFAKRMMDDEKKKAFYRLLAKKMKLPNAYTAAITEYMRKPEADVDFIDTEEGPCFEVTVRKSMNKVKQVDVELVTVEGKVVESGKARSVSSVKWQYKIGNGYGREKPNFIRVVIRDLSGNCLEKTIRICEAISAPIINLECVPRLIS